MDKINFPHVKFYNDCIYKLTEQGVNSYVLLFLFCQQEN